jgi:hypothetical protein
VTRTYDRWWELVQAGDLNAVASLCDPSYIFDDRRRLIRTTTGREAEVGNARFLLEGGWRPTRTTLATAGDRLALQRIVWTTSEAGAVSEIEVLELSELDAEGRFIRIVLFDPSDRASASSALFERYVASGAGGLGSNAIAITRAWNDHDLERLRALLPTDYYHYDRRRTGVGRLEGVDAYLASLVAIWDLSRDLRIELLYLIGTAEHGIAYVNRWSGTNAEGGDFDAVYVCIALLRGDEPAGMEIFELDDIELARARFVELSPGPKL